MHGANMKIACEGTECSIAEFEKGCCSRS